MSSRLPAHVEVTALIRQAESDGNFATVLRKGDGERGSIVLFLRSRGQFFAIYERILDIAGRYSWRKVESADLGESENVAAFLVKRARFDEDFWAIELDVASPERFIADLDDAS